MLQWRLIVKDRILGIDLEPKAESHVWTPALVDWASRGMLKAVLAAKMGRVS